MAPEQRDLSEDQTRPVGMADTVWDQKSMQVADPSHIQTPVLLLKRIYGGGRSILICNGI
jgi:hypothetical protein